MLTIEPHKERLSSQKLMLDQQTNNEILSTHKNAHKVLADIIGGDSVWEKQVRPIAVVVTQYALGLLAQVNLNFPHVVCATEKGK